MKSFLATLGKESGLKGKRSSPSGLGDDMIGARANRKKVTEQLV